VGGARSSWRQSKGTAQKDVGKRVLEQHVVLQRGCASAHYVRRGGEAEGGGGDGSGLGG
jgi:hypothetical protein